MGEPSVTSSSSLADLPVDELAAYGRELGVSTDPNAPRGQLLRLIRERQELLLTLDRDAMLELVAWVRVPVRRSAGKELLAKHIAGITRARFDELSDRGLRTLARLRGVQVRPGDPRSIVERHLRRQGGLWARVERRRRAVVGSLISTLFERSGADGDYQFLPEEEAGPSLKDSIENAGVVGGIAQKLRGAADQYIHEKLDEIELRIDRKLDEIDGRLAEWRDQEIKNRLRIVKVTLVTAIIVAIISLAYDYVNGREPAGGTGHPVAGARAPDAEN
jgi:hypothetical protein